MAVLAAPVLPTAPTEPNKGAAVSILVQTVPGLAVITRPLLPAPGANTLLNLSGGHPV